MDLPVMPPVSPMLAKAVSGLESLAAADGGYLFEPKWDGFRAVVFRDGDEVEIGGRNKTLTRYFPELVRALRENLPDRVVVDGEVVVRVGEPGAQRLDWETLSQRIHPAATRVERLSQETPASFIAFDLLAAGGDALLEEPFSTRRARLEEALAAAAAPVHLTRVTDDPVRATRWFSSFEGAGLDGLVAKPRRATYQPGKRVMLKLKHSRTADAVVLGYRVHTSGQGVGSLLLGLHTADGQLVGVGGASAFTVARRLELVDELDPYVVRDADGTPVRGDKDRNRFSALKDTTFLQLRPELVVEVKYDQMEGQRFRHAVQLLRFRPDRDPASCTYDQLDRPVAYDLDDVLTGAS